jgi:gas vesicle protein
MQFIIGAIVGAFLMALFAPQRGDVTREELRAATEDLRRRADDLTERARRASEDAQVRTQKLIDDARKQMQDIRPRDGGGSATA